MSKKEVNKKLSNIFFDLADALETGKYGEKTKVVVTTLGSEHGAEEVVRGAELAVSQNPDVDISLIGPKVTTVLPIICETDCEDTAHQHMNQLLEQGEMDAAVTMHYNFPIGVATVGRVVTPAMGKEMIISTSTGTSRTDRVGAMILNTIYGIITAKSLGISQPTVGILNVDGAKQVEGALKQLIDQGYPINLGESKRSDGGAVMRGNDLLQASADILVMDTLTGNLMMKMFSAFTTGGSYESLGFGYGPGVGKDHAKIINIISRASGAPVIACSIKFAKEAAEGNLLSVIEEEMSRAEAAGLWEIIESSEQSAKDSADVFPPAKKPVTEEISGIDIMILDDACKALWEEDIYAETGMGCSGPVVMVAPEDKARAVEILTNKNYVP